MTEAWFRNPDNYIRELVEVGVHNIVWDRGYTVKRKIDVDKHASLHFGAASDWRALVIGLQGTAEIRADSSMEAPTAVYPTWGYGESSALLEEMISQPVGEDEDICYDNTVPPDERPVFGQEHRVVITDLPDARAGAGRQFLKYLKEMQEEHPECIIHIHGSYSARINWGLNWGSADTEPRTQAAKGTIVLPSGRAIPYERAVAHAQWITAMGFKPSDLSIPRNRCMYNIKSAVWSARSYTQLNNFMVRNNKLPVDTSSSNKEFVPATTKSPFSTAPVNKKPGDMFECDTCSLTATCKYYREGAVCGVPGAETKDMAQMFKSRDSQMILDGLSELVSKNARRAERGMEDEEAFGEVNPETTKVIGAVFEQAVKLAKLRDPALRTSATAVQVNVGNGGTAAVATGNPRQLVATAIRELEMQGYARDQITPELIEQLIRPPEPIRAIQGEVISHAE